MDETLRLYAVVRTDLGMSAGKRIAQAGHAYCGALVAATAQTPATVGEYHKELPQSPGTKVALEADDLQTILAAQEACLQASIPHFLVVDSGCPDFHGGAPTITALGIGPATKRQVRKITRKFKLHQ